ncbi:hypothetical protein [Desertivirga xinjiangensis]|uniref:hypothetical protein n=1 Tax=Desertivirga xinjiangensis TaxID=539206 RepID=UPI00210D6CD2|nr:hypothetical protein [Pedobacter xinjiangensis]
MKIKIAFALTILGLLLNVQMLFAQPTLQLLFQIDTPATFIATDNLDNIYAITEKNELLKYSKAGKLLWNYSNKAMGRPSYADTTDPMRILLFYPAIQQAVVLNNTLNEINRFNFGHDTSRQITLVSTSNSNGYWVYDQANRQLQKLSNQFNPEQQSANIYQESGLAIQPEFMVSTDQNVYLYDPQTGILQTDRFGSYIKSFSVGHIGFFQVKDQELLFLNEGVWHRIDVSDKHITQRIPVGTNIVQASEGNTILATLGEKRIKVYSTNKGNENK